MPISPKDHAIVCRVCKAVFLGGVLLCGHAEPPVERPRIDVRAANPAALTPGGEHPIERARGFVGLSLTYESAAVTTSTGMGRFISTPTPYRSGYLPDASAIWPPLMGQNRSTSP